jgi:hypothetical protein
MTHPRHGLHRDDAALAVFSHCGGVTTTESGFCRSTNRFDEQTRQYDWSVLEEYLNDPGAQSCENKFKSIDMEWQARVEPLLEPVRVHGLLRKGRPVVRRASCRLEPAGPCG